MIPDNSEYQWQVIRECQGEFALQPQEVSDSWQTRHKGSDPGHHSQAFLKLAVCRPDSKYPCPCGAVELARQGQIPLRVLVQCAVSRNTK